MVWVLAVVLVSQVLEFGLCGISLMTLVSLIPKGLFALRIMGTVISTKVLATIECLPFVVWFVWHALLRHNMSMLSCIAFVTCIIVNITTYFLDGMFYVYVVQDDK